MAQRHVRVKHFARFKPLFTRAALYSKADPPPDRANRRTGKGRGEAMEQDESSDRAIPSEIRDELWARIAALDVRAPYAPAADLASGIDAIRRLAHAHGLAPAVTVTHFIDRALMRDGAAGPVHGWFAMLTDAVASERQDLETANRFAEACSVRMAG